ncbi:MAG: hypothetical protein SVR81_04940 [Chloroflexota bacterium]|nr:hypothetical protein [Chloroflexota bacterium]
MFLFLIELFLLGLAITTYFAGKLPDFFLAVTGVLVGYLVYFMNGFILVLVDVPLRASWMALLVSLELAGVILHQGLTKRLVSGMTRSLWLHYLGVAVVYFGVLVFFYFNNFFFATTDSVYLVVMARNLVESGLSKWYFSSPRGMGLFVPFIQTIPMLFGLDYAWFIQPAFMAAFIALFVFFAERSARRFIQSKVMRGLLVFLTAVLYVSADLVFIMTTYIHTNFDSGLFFFLAIASLYFGVEEDQPAWFVFVPAFLMGFGALRTENVITALILILIYVGSQKIQSRIQRRVFLPYLIFQFGLYLRILLMHPDTYSDQMSNGQILIVLAGVAAVAAVLYLTETKFLRSFILPRLWWLVPAGLLAVVSVLGAFNFQHLLGNLQVNLKAFFVTGNWGAVWWVVVALALLFSFRIQFPQKQQLLGLILSFFIMIALLGMLRVPYHERWFDSANRMLAHIAPLVLFYLITLAAAASVPSQPEALKGKKLV